MANAHWRTNPSLPPRGSIVRVKGTTRPEMRVLRHTQFENGDVEVMWFTENDALNKAWLPADMLEVGSLRFAIRRKIG